MNPVLRLSPLQVLILHLGLAVLGVLCTLSLALNQPWLGIEWQVPDHGNGLVVAAIDTHSPVAAALSGGERVVAIGGATNALALEAIDLLEEPDFLRSFAAYNAFLERQNRLHALLAAEPVVLRLADQTRRQVLAAGQRPLSDLPVAFWYQLFFAVACLSVAAAVWAYQRDHATLLFGLTGLGLFIVGLTAAVYSTRELALAAPDFRLLAAANHAGGMLFAAAFIATLWHYPRRLVQVPVSALTLSLFALIWLLDVLQWLPGVDWGFRLPLIAGFMLTFVLAAIQWRRTRSPLDRAALRWFLFAWFFGTSLFCALMFIPVLAGVDPLLAQSYSFGLLLLIYLGIAVGVARYRLFSIERWWHPTLAGSAALLAVLVVLPLLARFSALSAPVLAVVLIGLLGWVYFPIRALLARRARRQGERRTAPVLTEAVNVFFDPTRSSNSDRLWMALLEHLYKPLEIHPHEPPDMRLEASANGSTLFIPGTDDTRGYRLRWPGAGTRLFDDTDVETARALLPLIGSARDLRQAWESGARAERARIKADLEDDLAPRLYGQILRASTPAGTASARAALAEVRLLIDQLGAERRTLAQAVAEWQAQIEDLCELADVALFWQRPGEIPAARLAPQSHGNPLRILREAVTNGIDHAEPTYMEVAIAFDLPQIMIRLTHDGAPTAPPGWEKGRGLLNIQARARQLGGEAHWRELEPGTVSLRARLFLEYTA